MVRYSIAGDPDNRAIGDDSGTARSLNHEARPALAFWPSVSSPPRSRRRRRRGRGGTCEGLRGGRRQGDRHQADRRHDVRRAARRPRRQARRGRARRRSRKLPRPGPSSGVRTPAGTWTAAYGKADPAAGTPMAVGMHTRIGSVTKTFTGTVIMQLAEAGKLSLDDSDRKVCSGCSKRQPDKPPHACRHDERRRQLHPQQQVHRHLLREARDGLHAGPPPRRRHRRIADFRARRPLRLLEHQHDPARDGDREGHRASPSATCSRR